MILNEALFEDVKLDEGYRVWFTDLEKALKAFRSKVSDDLFSSIEGNAYGDFVFHLDDSSTYIVKHGDFSVWHNYGDWRNPDWREVNGDNEGLSKAESLKEEFVSNDKLWKLTEKIRTFIDEGHINKDELIDKLLAWFCMTPTFINFLITNNIFSEEEINSIVNESLKEDIDDVVIVDVPDIIPDINQDEITPKGPELGEDTGVANALLDLINGENSTIADYNGFIATVAESHPEFISAIEDIANEENNHVGMLQKLLQQISPNVQTIEQGQLEAEKDLIDDSNNFEVPDFEVDDTFDDGFGGIYI